jgi:hypothetical protein
MTFAITGIIFLILHFFVDGIWAYYVPAALIALSIWLKIIQPAWNADNFLMPSTKMDPSAAAGYLSIISIIYGIASLFFGTWIPLIICVIIFILSLTIKFPHPH